MEEANKELLIKLLDERIAELTKVRESLATSTGPDIIGPPHGVTTSPVTNVSSVPSRTGHVSDEAKKRLSQRMTLVWAVRKAKTGQDKKAAQMELEAFDRAHPKR
jgi:hypothetical protein